MHRNDSSLGLLSHSRGCESSSRTAVDLSHFVGRIVVPGMLISTATTVPAAWSLGSGIVQVPSGHDNSVLMLVRKLGILHYVPAADGMGMQTHRVWINSLQLVAVATGMAMSVLGCTSQAFHAAQFCVGDRVLGVVKKKTGDTVFLDIGCSAPASLSTLAFEGASKKNRPDIRLRDVIYAAISQADPDLEIELTCMDETGKATGMGILGRHEPGSVGNAGGVNGGVMITCSLELVRRLVDAANFPLVEKLSQRFPFEICVGCNGRIWLTARSPRETMLLANSIALADYVAPETCLKFAEDLC